MPRIQDRTIGRREVSQCAHTRGSFPRTAGFATAALAAGIPAKIVSERLGHANVQITLDIYSHVIPGLDEQAAATVARLILEGSETASMGSLGSDAANSAAKRATPPTPERR
jgi:hypothetical protein